MAKFGFIYVQNEYVQALLAVLLQFDGFFGQKLLGKGKLLFALATSGARAQAHLFSDCPSSPNSLAGCQRAPITCPNPAELAQARQYPMGIGRAGSCDQASQMGFTYDP